MPPILLPFGGATNAAQTAGNPEARGKNCPKLAMPE